MCSSVQVSRKIVMTWNSYILFLVETFCHNFAVFWITVERQSWKTRWLKKKLSDFYWNSLGFPKHEVIFNKFIKCFMSTPTGIFVLLRNSKAQSAQSAPQQRLWFWWPCCLCRLTAKTELSVVAGSSDYKKTQRKTKTLVLKKSAVVPVLLKKLSTDEKLRAIQSPDSCCFYRN